MVSKIIQELKLPPDISECHRLLKKQGEQILLLIREVQELRARLNQNSGNSSRPPSSDVIKPQRQRSTGLAKKPKSKGGQKGHKGGTLKMVEQADEVKQLRPDGCTCGQRLLRQESAIDQVSFELSEYQGAVC